MMNYEEKAKEILKKLRYYESVHEVMYCDRQFYLPKAGRAYMDEVSGFLADEAQKLLTCNETKEVLSYYKNAHIKDDYLKGCINKLNSLYDNATKVPLKLKIELNQFCAEAQEVWQEAYKENDFNKFKPYIEKQFQLQRHIAEAINPNEAPYDVLLKQWDRSLDTEKVTEIINVLKPRLIEIYQRSREIFKNTDKTILNIETERSLNEKIASKAAEIFGLNKDRGNIKEVMHPVCVCVGPRDSRATTNYTNLWMSIIHLMHECGHGIYNYSSNNTALSYGLWGGIDGMMHESQSRFYENMICKSKEFWQNFYPMIQEEVLELRDISLDEFYRALIKPEAAFKRMSADELTYNLHIMIRFEMERDYFQGKIALEDFPEIWNSKYEEYLGVTPKDSREGILQDVHWASGHVGYFQSYMMGDLYASQFRKALMKDIPNIYNEIERGNLCKVHQWMTEHIYQYGQTYTPDEILLNVTGETINPQYLIDYLEEKYTLK